MGDNFMARKARINAPGILFHVMARGIDGADIFKDDQDRERFVSFLGNGLRESDYRCHGWALVVNHYHLLVRSSEQPLWVLMKPLNSQYAAYYNKRHGRKGYLFQDRYKSIVTQDQNYLEQLVAYIHLNPLRSGLCSTIEELDRYPWCGHSVLTGFCHQPFQDTQAVLNRFGKNIELAREEYGRFIRDAFARKSEEPFWTAIRTNNKGRKSRQSAGSWVIGDPEFVRKVMAADRKKRTGVVRHAREQCTLDSLAAGIGRRMNLDAESIRFPSKRTGRADARMLLCFAGRMYGFPAHEIGAFLNISTSAVSNAARKGKAVAERKKIRKIENLIV
jgi:putative transposase